jgi:hypothetical protein
MGMDMDISMHMNRINLIKKIISQQCQSKHLQIIIHPE